jgi:ribosomal protein S18 acetylase RimI-like enzyme
MRDFDGTPADQMPIQDLRRLSRGHVSNVLGDLRNLERKTFSSNEVFPFADNIVLKQNTEVLVVYSSIPNQVLAAYAVCVKHNHRVLLHKICVSPNHRGKGLGSRLLIAIIENARKSGWRGIDLWVDEENRIARHLYSRHDFHLQETVMDYYAPGQTGMKMSRILQS